jgi:co-chaperonin GroES (HSP10)
MIQAVNGFVFLIVDEAAEEISGLYIPNQGQEKPSTGKIVTVGDSVQDKHLKKGIGKKCIFPKGVGFPIEHDGIEYLVVESERIFAVL